jgi:hypothetical protein
VIPERRMHAKAPVPTEPLPLRTTLCASPRPKSFQRSASRPRCSPRSTVAGERGAADAERDVRGFALKFYTEEGNWDVVGNNTPVFFFRGRIGAKNGQDVGANMKSVLSLAMFAAWALCFVAFVTKVRPAPVIATPSQSEQVRIQ